jgi:hypothetical protein
MSLKLVLGTTIMTPVKPQISKFQDDKILPSGRVMGNHRSKTANIRGFYLTHNTQLGLNKSMHSLPIVYMFLFMLVTSIERPLALDQLRQSNVS